jgi:hypothetical protein
MKIKEILVFLAFVFSIFPAHASQLILAIDVPIYCVTPNVTGATGYDYSSAIKLESEYTDTCSGFAGTSATALCVGHWVD